MGKTVLSLYTEGSFVQAALISRRGKNVQIDFSHSYDSETELNNVKLLYILKQHLPDKELPILSGLTTDELIYRSLSLKLTHDWALKKILPFQLESMLPYPIEEAHILAFSKRISKKEVEVELFSTRLTFLENHLLALKSQDIDPDQVSSIPHALMAFRSYFFPEENNIVIYHLGLKKSSYLLIEQGSLIACQTHYFGLNDLIEAFKKEGGDEKAWHSLDLLAALPEKPSPLLQVVNRFKQETLRIGEFLKKKQKIDGSSLSFLATGFLESNSSLKSFIETSFSPFFKLVASNSSLPDETVIPLGLALDFFYSKKKAQFRQGELIALKRKNQLKKWSLAYLICSGLAILAICTLGMLITKKRETLLINLFKTYLRQEEWPNSFTSRGNLLDDIFDWEEMVSELKRPLPLALNVPQVSDVLVWISSHPILNRDKAIEVTKVDYKLAKYPKLGESMETYLAKVELEFTAFSLKDAEDFHKTLLIGDDLVNPQKDITWSSHQNKYRTSFWLKAREIP